MFSSSILDSLTILTFRRNFKGLANVTWKFAEKVPLRFVQKNFPGWEILSVNNRLDRELNFLILNKQFKL